MNDLLDVDVPEANTAESVVENHCPCGCVVADLDERGYCPHLIGFGNVPKVGAKFEPTVPIMTKPTAEHPNGEHTGRYRTSGKRKDLQDILSSDILVNPSTRQIVGGVQRMAYRWVSWRVYRREKAKK